MTIFLLRKHQFGQRLALLGVLLALCQTMTLKAQELPAFQNTSRLYQDACQLFEKGKYSSAIDKFEQYLGTSANLDQPSLAPDASQMRDEAQYYRALCAYHLLNKGSEDLLSRFAEQHIDHPKRHQARYYQARLLVIKKQPLDALPILQAIDISQLKADQQLDAQFLLGYCQFEANQLEDANATLAPLTEKLGPYHDRANYYSGIAFYRRQKFDSALVCFIALEPSEVYGPQVPLYIAQCYLATGNYAELEKKGEKWLAPDQKIENRGQLLRSVGQGLFDRARYSAALPYLKSAAEDTSVADDAAASYRLGYAYYQNKQYAEAIDALRPLLTQADTLGQAANYVAGFAQVELGKKEEARLLFKQAYDMGQYGPYAQDALFQYAKLSYETRYFQEATTTFRQFLQKYPSAEQAARAKGLLGEVLFYANSFGEAINYFEAGDLRDLRTRTAYQKALYFFGLGLYEQGEYARASSYLTKAGEVQANDQQALAARFWMAEAFYKLEEFLKAAEAYASFTQNPKAATNKYYAQGLIGLGWCHFRDKSYLSALAQFAKVIALADIDKQPDVLIEALNRTGDCHFISKNYTRALYAYSRAADMRRPASDYALYQGGIALMRLERYEDAARTLQRLIDGYRNSAYRDDALDQLGDVYVEWLNNYAKGATVSDQLIREYPGNSLVAGAYRRLAKAALKSENYPDCIKYLKVLLFEYGDEEALTSLQYLVRIEELAKPDLEKIQQQFRAEHPLADSVQAGQLFKEALDRFDRDDYDQALDRLNKYVDRYPGNKNYYDALLLRGSTYERQRDMTRALADYKAVFEAPNADDAGVRALLAAATLEFGLGKFAEAGLRFAEAERRAEVDGQRIQALLGRGSVLVQTKKYREAESLFRQIKADAGLTVGTRKQASLQLAYLLVAQDKPDSARTVFRDFVKTSEKAGEKDAFWAEAQYMIARTYADQLRWKEAKEAALYLKNNNAKYNEWQARAELVVGESYAALEQKAEAQQVFRSMAQSENIRSNYPEIGRQAASRYFELSGKKLENYDSTASPTATVPKPSLIQPVDLDVSGGRSETVITKERVEGLPTSQKFQPTPPTPNLEVPATSLGYTPLQQAYLPRTAPLVLKSPPLPKEKWEPLYPYHFKVALGRYWSPVVGIYLGSKRDTRLRWTFEGNNFSAPTAHVKKGQFTDTDLRLNFAYHWDKHTLRAAANYQLFTYNYYSQANRLAYDSKDTLQQLNHRFNLQIAFARNFNPKGLSYSLPLNIEVYADRAKYYGRSEAHIGFRPSLNYAIRENLSVEVELDVVGSNVTYGKPTDLGLTQQKGWQFRTGVTPSVRWAIQKVSIRAGLGLYGFNTVGTKANFALFPLVEVAYNPLKDYLTPYLTLTGRPQYNTLYDLAPFNRWTAADARLRAGTEWVNLQIGARGHYKIFQYDVRFFFRYVANQLLFNNNYELAGSPTIDYNNTGFFKTFYEPNFTETGFSLQLAVDDNERYRAGLKLDYSSYKLPFYTYYYGMPNFRAQIFGGYTFFRKLNFLLQVNLIGERVLGLTSFGEVHKGQFVADLNLHIEYNISKKFSVFVQFNNMANFQYFRWNGYLERPFDFRIGGSVSLR
jgi:TolA-binding protein